MDEKALELVRNYINEHLDKSDPAPVFDLYIVWKAKVLQNWKYLISSTLSDGMFTMRTKLGFLFFAVLHQIVLPSIR